MQTQIATGAHDDDRAAEMNADSGNDGQLPEDFINSDAEDAEADGEVDAEADAAVAPRCGFWSSKNFKLIAGLTLLSALICVFAAGGSSIKEYHMGRSNAANLKTTYDDYGAATASQKTKSSKKCKSPKAPKSPKSPKASKTTRNLKSKKGNTPTSSTEPPTTCAPTTTEKKSKGSKTSPPVGRPIRRP